MKRGLLDWEEPMGGLLGGYSPSPELRGLLQSEGLVGNPFAPPPPAPPLRLWPQPPPDDEFWQQFHNDQLYKDVPREDIPPAFRPPLNVPDIDPEFFWDRWLRRRT